MSSAARTITACAALVAALGFSVYALALKSDDSVPTFSNIKETSVPEKTTESTLPDDWASMFEYAPSPTGLTERAKIFLKQNSDMIGWIKIDNTQLDYPVVKDPGAIKANTGYGDSDHEPNSFYLHAGIDKSYLYQGTIYMDYRNAFGSSEDEQSENIVLYGHNMNNGSMFGSLRKYRYDYSYYDDNPFIEFSSNYKDYQYIIFGFFITSGDSSTDFDYWNMEELDTEEAFNNYVNTVNSRAMLDTGVDVKYGDKLLTLSTCVSDGTNNRFIVVARRLRDNEIPGELSSIDRTQDYLDKLREEATREEETTG